MSGHINFEIPQDEERQQRYNRMIQKLNSNSKTGSMTSASLNNVTVQRSYNGTLSTQDFYSRTTNPFKGNEKNSNVSTYTSSILPSSSSSVFKLPQTQTSYKLWSQFEKRFGMMTGILQQLEDKQSLKFILRLMEEAIHYIKNPPNLPPIDFVRVSEHIHHNLREYYANRPSKSLCGTSSMISDQMSQSSLPNHPSKSHCGTSSMISDQMSQSGQRENNLESLLSALDRQSALTCSTQPRVNVTRIADSSHRRQVQPSENISQVPNSFLKQQQLVQKGGYFKINSSPVLDDSSLALFAESESVLAQRRDESAAKKERPKKQRLPSQSKTNISSFKRPAEYSKKVNTQFQQGFPNLNEGTPGVQVNGSLMKSCRGRTLKNPVEYWNSKGYEMKSVVNKYSNSKLDTTYSPQEDLNETMTLRSKKVVQKKPSPLSNNVKEGSNSSKVPLNTIKENQISTTDEKKPKEKKPASNKKNGKENSKGNKTKKQSDGNTEKIKKQTDGSTETKSVKKTAKRLPKKEEENKNQVKEKTSTKTVKKRKSKDTSNTASKKKKIEDLLEESSCFGDDDLFGEENYKKKCQPIQAISPGTGLLSAKKAAANHLGKETPPCKMLGEMINISAHSAISSVAKEAPAALPKNVVKRVAKVITKQQNITTKHKKGKDQSSVSKIVQDKFHPSSLTPLTSAFTTDFGMEAETDEEEGIEGDDDEDLI